MAQPVYPLYNVPALPGKEMSIRSRKEFDTRDCINSRQFEHWQTDGKYSVHNRPDLNKQAPFNDNLPINSRFNEKNYSAMPRFDHDNHRGSLNPYFDKYDTVYDSRNTIRELRGAIYEDKYTGYNSESKHLLERNFDNRWLDAAQLKKQVEVTEDLRYKMDDITKVYINKK
jgi:hypothetical protein